METKDDTRYGLTVDSHLMDHNTERIATEVGGENVDAAVVDRCEIEVQAEFPTLEHLRKFFLHMLEQDQLKDTGFFTLYIVRGDMWIKLEDRPFVWLTIGEDVKAAVDEYYAEKEKHGQARMRGISGPS